MRTIFVICLLILSVFNESNGNFSATVEIPKKSRGVLKVVELKYEFLNFKNLRKFLLEIDVRFPDIVLRQIITETGWLKSYNCTERNNLFGMRIARKRRTLATNKETDDDWAKFDRWKDSVRDYKIWQDYVLNGVEVTTDQEYINYIVFRAFYTDNQIEYVNLINSINLSRTGLKQYESRNLV